MRFRVVRLFAFVVVEHYFPIVENSVLYNMTTGGDFMPFK